ncbi:MAG: flavodoxin domain-containing protein [Methanomassiliicoccales archaeon]|nr:flavodoxin domain-containing protein [Methanomassiliicoccales archaeon]
MSNKRSQVVYYSRTGTTKKIANEIFKKLECDEEEIVDMKSRAGAMRYVDAGRDVKKRVLTTIQEPIRDPAEYDLLIIGTPVWAGSLSVPVKTYCTQMRGRVGRVAFFLTQDGDESSAFDEMRAILGKDPISSLALNGKKEVDTGTYPGKLDAFLDRV